LDLHYNQLTQLPTLNNQKLFQQLNKLKINFNFFTKLPINFLQYLTKLEYLDISTNDFEILNQQFPKNLNTLKTLKMDSLNKLKIIKCNIFNKMELLEEIDIAHSNISQLDNCIFNGLTQLKI
ncbi:unnamed protein product, partial [Didymodactylos carnosus]